MATIETAVVTCGLLLQKVEAEIVEAESLPPSSSSRISHSTSPLRLLGLTGLVGAAAVGGFLGE